MHWVENNLCQLLTDNPIDSYQVNFFSFIKDNNLVSSVSGKILVQEWKCSTELG